MVKVAKKKKKQKRKRILLIDANNLAYRNYYGVQGLTTQKGFPTNMVYGFLTSLMRMARRFKPLRTVIVWDGKRKTWRHEYCDKLVEEGKYKRGYKAGRKKDAEFIKKFYPQVKVLRQILRYAGFEQYIGFESEQRIGLKDVGGRIYEADDVIGSLARYYGITLKKSLVTIIIVSGDKDFQQCVGHIGNDRGFGKVVLARPSVKDDGFVLVTEKTVRKKYGLTPHQLISVGAIMGDGSDNIEGVPGLGIVTAVKIMREVETLATLLLRLDNDKTIVNASVTKKLMESKHKLWDNFFLKQIECFLQVDGWSHCLAHHAKEDMNFKEVKKLLRKCEIESMEAVDLMECNRHLLKGR